MSLIMSKIEICIWLNTNYVIFLAKCTILFILYIVFMDKNRNPRTNLYIPNMNSVIFEMYQYKMFLVITNVFLYIWTYTAIMLWGFEFFGRKLSKENALYLIEKKKKVNTIWRNVTIIFNQMMQNCSVILEFQLSIIYQIIYQISTFRFK